MNQPKFPLRTTSISIPGVLLLSVFLAGSGALAAKKTKKAEPAARPWPETQRQAVTDTLHGVLLSDPYRWLEKADDPAVQQWMEDQDKVARKQLEKLGARSELRDRFEELYYIDTVSPPKHEGRRYFYSRTHADREKAIVYYREGERGEEVVLFDPNEMGDGENVALHGWFPSYNGRYVAYKISKNNADAATMLIRDVKFDEDLEPDVIEGAKYADASWTPDSKGFYYTWLPSDPAIPIDELPGYAEVRFHLLGEDPESDTLVHPALGNPKAFLGADLSRDGRWLLLNVSYGWSRTDIYMQDLKGKAGVAVSETAEAATENGPETALSPSEEAGFRPLIVGRDALYHVGAWKNQLYIHTNDGAPRYRLFKVEARNPERDHWREIVPERPEATLDAVQVVGNRLVLLYVRNAVCEMEVRTLEGKYVRQVEVPALGTVSQMVGNPHEDDAYFSFTSFTDMPQIFRTSVRSGETSLWESIEYPIDVSAMISEQVWYPSKDGTQISMFIVHRKDMQRDGENPVLLTGYGGFNSNITPRFSPTTAVWVEHGGIWAIPNLRGGGEYGEEWHRGGMLEHKQNVFDDFIAAAEFLIDKQYTRPERLAISGGSNGGLLVGAAMTQRPELFRAVVCSAPLLDMVRYHRFGSGRTWIEEYGSADDPKQFKFIHAYSPYHRIEKGVAYPALLMDSPDSDDRVDPMHARKFVAAVQWATSSSRPVWMRVEKHAGHGGADLVRQAVERSADHYAFIFDQLGMN